MQSNRLYPKSNLLFLENSIRILFYLYYNDYIGGFWNEFKLSGKVLISLYLEFMVKSALSMILELMKFRKTIGTVSKKKCLSRKLRNTFLF